MPIPYQANADGTLVQADHATWPDFDAQVDVVISGFQARSWQCTELSRDKSKRLLQLQVSRGDVAYELRTYIFLNFAWGNREKRLYEKRIQLSRPKEEHQHDFALDPSEKVRCLLLGMYNRDGKVVISGWKASYYINHGLHGACWTDVRAVANAMRNGFGQHVDDKERIICAFQPDLLPFYVENLPHLHDRVVDANAVGTTSATLESFMVSETVGAEEEVLDVNQDQLPPNLPRNRILYGAPGTGKSHRLNDEVEALFPDDQLRERVTFHPDYTYAQFVGSYRPTPVYRDSGGDLFEADGTTPAKPLEPLIDYRFVPGPFLRMLVKALKHPDHSFVLVVEELNRANAPAVFGEVFQLLDRDSSGIGKFTVTLSTEARAFLEFEGLAKAVRLPPNLYLWATMNSADQGVMPLDAAFKRRWSFEYVPLDAGEQKVAGWMIDLKLPGGPIEWNAFRHAVNGQLAGRGVPEDRLLGPFFMREDELADPDALSNKLLLYLRDDVARHEPEMLFRSPKSFGELVRAWKAGEQIFVPDLGFGGSA